MYLGHLVAVLEDDDPQISVIRKKCRLLNYLSYTVGAVFFALCEYHVRMIVILYIVTGTAMHTRCFRTVFAHHKKGAPAGEHLLSYTPFTRKHQGVRHSAVVM
jgi:hypothetical protein